MIKTGWGLMLAGRHEDGVPDPLHRCGHGLPLYDPGFRPSDQCDLHGQVSLWELPPNSLAQAIKATGTVGTVVTGSTPKGRSCERWWRASSALVLTSTRTVSSSILVFLKNGTTPASPDPASTSPGTQRPRADLPGHDRCERPLPFRDTVNSAVTSVMLDGKPAKTRDETGHGLGGPRHRNGQWRRRTQAHHLAAPVAHRRARHAPVRPDGGDELSGLSAYEIEDPYGFFEVLQKNADRATVKVNGGQRPGDALLRAAPPAPVTDASPGLNRSRSSPCRAPRKKRRSKPSWSPFPKAQGCCHSTYPPPTTTASKPTPATHGNRMRRKLPASRSGSGRCLSSG